MEDTKLNATTRVLSLFKIWEYLENINFELNSYVYDDRRF
jgi:hypothetical protein